MTAAECEIMIRNMLWADGGCANCAHGLIWRAAKALPEAPWTDGLDLISYVPEPECDDMEAYGIWLDQDTIYKKPATWNKEKIAEVIANALAGKP